MADRIEQSSLVDKFKQLDAKNFHSGGHSTEACYLKKRQLTFSDCVVIVWIQLMIKLT